MLSDAEQRAVYDEQGRVDEEGEALRGERDWQEYWRLLFKKVRAGSWQPRLGSQAGLWRPGASPLGTGVWELQSGSKLGLGTATGL